MAAQVTHGHLATALAIVAGLGAWGLIEVVAHGRELSAVASSLAAVDGRLARIDNRLQRMEERHAKRAALDVR